MVLPMWRVWIWTFMRDTGICNWKGGKVLGFFFYLTDWWISKSEQKDPSVTTFGCSVAIWVAILWLSDAIVVYRCGPSGQSQNFRIRYYCNHYNIGDKWNVIMLSTYLILQWEFGSHDWPHWPCIFFVISSLFYLFCYVVSILILFVACWNGELYYDMMKLHGVCLIFFWLL